jgi:hypothetical protein
LLAPHAVEANCPTLHTEHRTHAFEDAFRYNPAGHDTAVVLGIVVVLGFVVVVGFVVVLCLAVVDLVGALLVLEVASLVTELEDTSAVVVSCAETVHHASRNTR